MARDENGNDDRSAPDGTERKRKRLTGRPLPAREMTKAETRKAAIGLCCGNGPIKDFAAWARWGGDNPMGFSKYLVT